MATTIERTNDLVETPYRPERDRGELPYRLAGRPSPSRRRFAGLRRAFLLLTAGLVVATAGWFGVEHWSVLQPAARSEVTGVIEADEVLVSSEVAARLVDLRVEEGQSVQAGTLLARLDDAGVRLQFQLGDAPAKRGLDIEMEKYALRAPISGLITRTPMRRGELTLPGQPVIALADLARLKSTLYVPVRDLGQVAVGQAVEISADYLPGQSFWGKVLSINSRAEYTPRNVQTSRDRMNMVFGVKVRIDNPDGVLRPGLPVDARFLPDGPGA